MADIDLAGQLAAAAAKLLALNNTKFREYWELYLQTSETSEIQNLFVRVDEDAGYCNIAVMGAGRIADIEGDDNDNSGSMRVFPLSAVSEITLHRGSIPSLSHSQGASLVILLRLVGLDESVAYWAAHTPDQEAQLLGFARSLVQYISDK